MLTQVNNNGFTMTMIQGIIGYKLNTDKVVSKCDMYGVIRRCQQKLRKTTCGRKLLVKRKDENESWIHIKDSKESYPIGLAEYTRACGIADNSTFIWWVPYTL